MKKAKAPSAEDLSSKERELLNEIEEFNKERDRIRMMVGKIGGARYSKIDNLLNAIFLSLILFFFVMEAWTEWLPTYISLEISVLLVSIKIVWMIHSQQKYQHFVFWILNSIEFRENEMARHYRYIERRLDDVQACVEHEEIPEEPEREKL